MALKFGMLHLLLLIGIVPHAIPLGAALGVKSPFIIVGMFQWRFIDEILLEKLPGKRWI